MEVDHFALCISVVVSLAPIHDNLCSTFKAHDDLVRGDFEVLRVSSVVDEDYLDQLRLACQVFPEVFEGTRSSDSRGFFCWVDLLWDLEQVLLLPLFPFLDLAHDLPPSMALKTAFTISVTLSSFAFLLGLPLEFDLERLHF